MYLTENTNDRYATRLITEGPRGNLSHVSHSAGVKPPCVMNVVQLFTVDCFNAAATTQMRQKIKGLS